MSNDTLGPVDVLVVGAGPVGLALAVDLRRRGIRVRIIDAADAPSVTSRATSLTARTVEVLDDLGAARELLATGVRIAETEAYAAGRLTFRLRFPSGLDTTRYPFLLNVSQAETEAALNRALERLGGRVERGVEWVGLAQDRTGVTAQVRTGGARVGSVGEIACQYLVAADGGRSRIRKSLAIDFPGEVIPETVVLGDVMLDWDRPATRIYSWFSSDGALLAFPFATPGLWRVTAALTAEELGPYTERAATDPLAALTDLYRRRTGDHRTTLSGLTWHSAFVAQQRVAARFRAGRVFLAGDAGHIHTPAGGLGMNTGIQDAYNLGWKLAHAVDSSAGSDSLLDTYETERRPIAQALLTNTNGLQRLYAIRNPAAQAVRDGALRTLLAVDPVRRAFFVRAGQLDLGYRSSPLSRMSPSRGRVGRAARAGDRVPDAALSHLDGTPTTLHDELRGVEPVLVVLHDDAVVSAGTVAPFLAAAAGYEVRLLHITRSAAGGQVKDAPVLLDASGALHARLGIGRPSGGRPVAVVVRPDKYLSAAHRPGKALTAHLEQIAGHQRSVRDQLTS